MSILVGLAIGLILGPPVCAVLTRIAKLFPIKERTCPCEFHHKD